MNMPNSGLDAMVDSDRLEDLSRLYRLFIMVPTGLPALKKALRDSVIRRGQELNISSALAEGVDLAEDEPDDIKGKGKAKARPANSGAQTLQLALKWVEDVLALKDKCDGIWMKAFQSDREVESGLNEVRKNPTIATGSN